MMRSFTRKSLVGHGSCLLFFLFSMLLIPAHSQTPVAAHGQLSISGNRLKDENGDNYQLRGMSFYWSNWQGKYWNYDVVKWLRDDWNCNVVRAAMGISPSDNSGYLSYPEIEKHKMETVIEAAIDLGLYVIIDWHSHYAQNETESAKVFFAEMAQKYGSYPNIIYETYNEPITDWTTISTYHDAVVAEIRKYDTKNVIILGTPFYSQSIDEATSSPISGTNLCYALHYYAATHTFWNSVATVSNKGYYVFVSEFGTCDASGAGSVDATNSETWWDVLDQYGVSWCNWAVSDVDEAASCVVPGASITGGWSPTSDLTTSGALVRTKLRGYSADAVPANIAPYITSNPQTQSVPYQASATFSVEVAGPSPFTYQWYFGGEAITGATSASYTIASVTEQDTGSYYCVINNSYGTTTSKTAGLSVRYRSTYYGYSQVIPGIIQFEDYDIGGQNIGYFDASYGNSGGGYRDDDVDIEEIDGQTGEYSVGFTDNDEWMSYSVNVGWDGEYTVDVYYASLNGGGSFSLYVDDTAVISTTVLGSTGGWYTFATQSATIDLTAGEHILKYKIDVSGYNIDFMEFKSVVAPDIAPYITAQPKNTNARVGKSASLYVSATGAETMTYQWYFNGEAIPGATSATYALSAVALADSGDYYVVITNSLGTVTSKVATLTVLNTNAYEGIPAEIPGRVLCKNWDEGGEGYGFHDATPAENEGVTNSGSGNSYRENGVDVETCTDGSSGFSIGYVEAGEWLEYSVTVNYTGTYTVGFRVASGSTTGVMALGITVDGTTLINTLSVPNTGGWSTWQTLESTVSLTAGSHVLRLTANQGDFNINYMDFTLVSATSTVTIVPGWNLFALPIVPADSSVSAVFSALGTYSVKTQDRFFDSDQPASFNSLTTLASGTGYIVYNGGAKVTLTLTGQPSTQNPAFAQLASGWNLVGLSADAVKTSTLGTYVTEVKNFDKFYVPGNAQATLTNLSPGNAYFVKVQK